MEYPFHDAEPELVKDDLIRRARVWTESDKSWKFILPFQTWPDGEVRTDSCITVLISLGG